MAALQVKKVVAVCFLEAVKTTLDHLGVYRLELSEKGVTGPAELTRAYGDGRRLRDYLQRCVSGFQGDVDLPDADQALLVACCRRFIEASEHRIATSKLAPEELQWLDKKLQVLAHWAHEIAEAPLLELPLKRVGIGGQVSRALTSKLREKVSGRATQVQATPPKAAPPVAEPTPRTGASLTSAICGVPTFGDELFVAKSAPDAAGNDGGSGDVRATASPAKSSAQPAAPRLLDPRKIVEPRLRGLANVDLHAYDRAVAAGDWRLATILCASVLESALLDYAFPRQEELGLSGAPDTWDLPRLLAAVMRDHGDARDASLAGHVFAARSMLRPAVQLTSPTIVTQVSFERLRDFVRRVLHCFGFAAQSQEAADAWAAPTSG